MVIPMRGFELRAKFYPLVPTLAQLAEEAQEGVDYPFEVRQVLQLQNKEYQQLCKALDKGYGFERMLPEEGYDPVYGSFICVLITTASRKQGILMARSYNSLFAAFLPDCTLLDLENVPCQQIPLDRSKHPQREAVR